ncbi:MAG: hypothetical protein M1399_08040 [Actinobacteria bacterium]|nr:hypothetical protein [Actinomycetota bacterium]MCL5446610.1 hypothetical protein [Actinomycetota bacterium]
MAQRISAAPGPSFAGQATSITRIIVPGNTGPGGYRHLVAAPGEAHTERADNVISATGGPGGGAGTSGMSLGKDGQGAATRDGKDHAPGISTYIPTDSVLMRACDPEIPLSQVRPVIAFVHMTDAHVTDAQSPARAEFLSMLQRAGSRLVPIFKLIEAYRPQEPFSAHVVESMCRAVRDLRSGPVTGAPVSLVMTTGDAVEISQQNEMEWFAKLLNGNAQVTPDSGDAARWDGIGGAHFYDPQYWHPDGTPAGRKPDMPRAFFGFPEVPGLLDAARRPFMATGPGVPWHVTIGNHDKLVGGFSPPTLLTSRMATGRYKLRWQPVPWRRVKRDSGREIGYPIKWISTHIEKTVTGDALPSPPGTSQPLPPESGPDKVTAGSPRESMPYPRTWYGFDTGPLRCLVLDTVNPWGGLEGSMDAEQLAWMEAELIRSSSRWRRDDGTWTTSRNEDRLCVLFSHHPFETLVNGYVPRKYRSTGSRRVLGYEFLSVLSRFPNAVLWMNGHTHAHRVSFIPALNPQSATHGIWQITTASLIDWPQQSRIVEIGIDSQTGELLIVSTVLDHAAPIDPRGGGLDDPLTLASWSRELAANHWIHRNDGYEPVGRGQYFDRNVIIRIPPPFPLQQ